MEFKTKSIRAFIGAENFDKSRQFYIDLGFNEIRTSEVMSFFKIDDFRFYFHNYYVKDWVNNSMIFLEVKDLKSHLEVIKSKKLEQKYLKIRISEIHYND